MGSAEIEPREPTRLLAVCSFVPWPANRGDPLRVFNLLERLQQEVDLTVWCVESDGNDADGLAARLPHARVEIFRRTKTRVRGPMGGLWRYVTALTTGVPSWVLKRTSDDLKRRVADEASRWDAVMALGEASAAYMPTGGWHWDKFNVLTASARGSATQARTLRDRIKYLADGMIARRFERRMARRATTISVTNDEEAARLRTLLGRQSVVVSSAIQMPANPHRTPVPGRILWLGNLGYHSNLDGLMTFLDEGWARTDPALTLHVVGSGGDASIERRILRHARVVYRGFVPELDETLASATAAVVPIWTGGGTRMKTITMMGASVPIFGTPEALEGIRQSDSTRIAFVADSAEELADLLSETYRSHDIEQVGRAGRDLVLDEYSANGTKYSHQITRLLRELRRQSANAVLD